MCKIKYMARAELELRRRQQQQQEKMKKEKERESMEKEANAKRTNRKVIFNWNKTLVLTFQPLCQILHPICSKTMNLNGKTTLDLILTRTHNIVYMHGLWHIDWLLSSAPKKRTNQRMNARACTVVHLSAQLTIFVKCTLVLIGFWHVSRSASASARTPKDMVLAIKYLPFGMRAHTNTNTTSRRQRANEPASKRDTDTH